MCGICGFLSLKGDLRVRRREILSRMCAFLKHRGPDDEGAYFDDSIALGIRRLTIIDIKTGRQPIHNENKTIWVVYNGEIYNFLELRGDLEKHGHRFYTQADTEVLVHLYEKYGEKFVNYLNGMFAFALWDKNKQKLLLGRDRLGQKPLYYLVFNHHLIFGSEVKAILEYPGIKKEIDFSSLSKYLAYEFIPAPHSIFKNIKKVLPGHFLSVRKGRLTGHCYWDIDLSRKIQTDKRALPHQLRGLLRDAVKRRLMSDVPLGVLLSGGIDSSTIVALMSEVSKQKIKTFTMGFEDKSFDEMKYARQVARLFNTRHYEQILQPHQTLALIPEITEILDEPFGDASIIPTFLISKFARKKITVGLGGDGGDELLAGYPTYQAHRLADYYEKVPEIVRRLLIEKAVKKMPVSFDNFSLDFEAKKFISGLPYSSLIRHYVWLGSFSPQEIIQLLRPEAQEQIAQEEIFVDLIRYAEQFNLNKELIDQVMYLDLKLYLPDDILFKVDRASMACSLEVRAPFLDYKLVEFMASLPVEVKLKGLKSKYILKKAMEGILPDNVLNRKKKGFGMPVAKWISNELKPLVLDVFSEVKIKREGIFQSAYINQLLADHFAKRKDNRKQLWTLLIFELWRQKYIK